ncbi:actinia tenebrosa protease inhibitors-like [Hypanus sabinus]|uniref:actinia tenebrosa protease inhibitors-like n=1 Tax=Hypanus sabinus TaxID=79690 RepID=UPI0028C4B0A8|nr:actinia tenebrosa protease inhibitors-like [Hypanus sabinus]
MKWGIVVLISCILLLSLPCSAEGKDKCSDPKKSGPCKAAIPRYYYNAKTRKCEKFKFGGCGATGNNFSKQSDCIALCEKSINCSDPKKIGSCKNYFPYYYYNTKTQKCEKFMYSGCGGNGNRFMQKNDCIIRCERSSNKCSDPKKSGPCKALIPRYYYNAKTRKCEKFKFGGCGATGNNFSKQSDCIALCEKSKPN